MRFQSRLHYSYTLVDMTPLIDVVFLMLIFFLVTSDVLPLKSLNIRPPLLKQESAALTSQLIVVMDAQNVIYVGGERRAIVDLHSVREQIDRELVRLQDLYHGAARPTLVLSVDRTVDYASFFSLLAAVQGSGLPIRLAYRSEEPVSGPGER